MPSKIILVLQGNVLLDVMYYPPEPPEVYLVDWEVEGFIPNSQSNDGRPCRVHPAYTHPVEQGRSCRATEAVERYLAAEASDLTKASFRSTWQESDKVFFDKDSEVLTVIATADGYRTFREVVAEVQRHNRNISQEQVKQSLQSLCAADVIEAAWPVGLAEYEIEQYEIHTSTFRVKAQSEAAAIKMVLDGTADRQDDSGEFIEVCQDLGLSRDEHRELAEELKTLGVPVGQDIIPSIREIHEV